MSKENLKNIIQIAITCGLLAFLFWIIIYFTCFYRIEQEVDSDYRGRLVLKTYVWHGTNIVWSKYDNIENISDSLIEARTKEANSIIDKVRHINKRIKS